MEREPGTTSRASRIVGGILILLSTIALCFGCDQLLRSMKKRSEWNSVTATVTQLVPRRGSDDIQTSYTPCFSFRDTAADRMITVKGRTASNPPAFRLGEKVEMLYPTGHPEDAIANTTMELYSTSIICGVIGAVLGIMGLLMRTGGARFGSLLADERDSRACIELGPVRLRLPGSIIGRLLSPPKMPSAPTPPQSPAPAEKSDASPPPHD